MFKYFIFLFFFIFITNTKANNKTQIIENLEKTKNLSFEFEQNINGKIENGNCIIEYPKKINETLFSMPLETNKRLKEK